eukprot:196291_1
MSVNFRVSNKWSNQQIRKKIRNKRQIRQYYKTKNKDKPFKSKHYKSNSVSFKMLHCDIEPDMFGSNIEYETDIEYESVSDYADQDEYYEFNSRCGCYTPERPELNWITHSVNLRPLFNFIDNRIKQWKLTRKRFHFPIPNEIPHLQQLIFDCLHHCESNFDKCDDMNLKSRIRDIMYAYECYGEWCGDCYTEP